MMHLKRHVAFALGGSAVRLCGQLFLPLSLVIYWPTHLVFKRLFPKPERTFKQAARIPHL
jgi:hypothetical protein